MKKYLAIAAALFLLAAFSPRDLLEAQVMGATTQEIFKQFSEHVVKIEVVETGSAAKASIGTGFYVRGGGHIFYNFHVVSKLIPKPDHSKHGVTTLTESHRHARA